MEYEWEGKEVGESGIYEEEEEELAVAKTRCQVTRFSTRSKSKIFHSVKHFHLAYVSPLNRTAESSCT